MRAAVVAFAFFVLTHTASAAQPFSGAWSSLVCEPVGSEYCGGFTLYLAQKGARICGTHWYATMGAGKLDASEARSIFGTVKGRAAHVTIISGRDRTKFVASLELRSQRLVWRALPVNESQIGTSDALIPYDARLRKVRDTDNVKTAEESAQLCAGYLRDGDSRAVR